MALTPETKAYRALHVAAIDTVTGNPNPIFSSLRKSAKEAKSSGRGIKAQHSLSVARAVFETLVSERTTTFDIKNSFLKRAITFGLTASDIAFTAVGVDIHGAINLMKQGVNQAETAERIRYFPKIKDGGEIIKEVREARRDQARMAPELSRENAIELEDLAIYGFIEKLFKQDVDRLNANRNPNIIPQEGYINFLALKEFFGEHTDFLAHAVNKLRGDMYEDAAKGENIIDRAKTFLLIPYASTAGDLMAFMRDKLITSTEYNELFSKTLQEVASEYRRNLRDEQNYKIRVHRVMRNMQGIGSLVLPTGTFVGSVFTYQPWAYIPAGVSLTAKMYQDAELTIGHSVYIGMLKDERRRIGDAIHTGKNKIADTFGVDLGKRKSGILDWVENIRDDRRYQAEETKSRRSRTVKKSI